MELGKRTGIVSPDKKNIEKAKTQQRNESTEVKKSLDVAKKNVSQPNKRNGKFSMIPKLKPEKTEKSSQQKFNRNFELSKLPRPSKTCIQDDEYDRKLKVLEAKENSIAEHYLEIEGLIQTIAGPNFNRNYSNENQKIKESENIPKSSVARKMTSDPFIRHTAKVKKDVVTEFENDVQQIANVWLKTSSDLTNTLNNLKNNSCLDPTEFEAERQKLQMAIKEAKSFTVSKTRDVIAEAKKLLLQKEMIRVQLENIISSDDLKLEKKELASDGKLIDLKNGKVKLLADFDHNPFLDVQFKIDEMGDSTRQNDSSIKAGTKFDAESDLGGITKTEIRDSIVKKEDLLNVIKESSKEEAVDTKEKRSDKPPRKFDELNKKDVTPKQNLDKSAENWSAELAKKNETITHLNFKILELQIACKKCALKYNQLQIKFEEFNENIQWNQVLWKQIRKLKDRIKGLQLINKQLESQNSGLESKIKDLEQELDRLSKLNHLLIQKNNKLTAQEVVSPAHARENQSSDDSEKKVCKQKRSESLKNKFDPSEKVLKEKQHVVEELKTILQMMKEQENIAHRQIAVFESKIEEFKNSGRT